MSGSLPLPDDRPDERKAPRRKRFRYDTPGAGYDQGNRRTSDEDAGESEEASP